MRIEDFNWEALYEKVDNFMKSIKSNEYIIATNKGSLYGNDAIVEVSFPKRVNAVAIVKLDKNNACIKRKGYIKDNKLFYVYGIYVNRLN